MGKKTELEEFVGSTLQQIKSALPEGFRIDDKINFNVGVVTTSKTDGGVDIKLAKIGANVESQTIHKVQFSVVDEVAQEKSWKQGQETLSTFFQSLANLDNNQLLLEEQNGEEDKE